MKSRAVALFAVTLLLSAGSSKAARIYSLVNYPDLQNGHTLSGTITTTDDALDDGLLVTEEILEWKWSITGPNNVSAEQSLPASEDSMTLAQGVKITRSTIEVTPSPDVKLSMEETKGTDTLRLSWFTSEEEEEQFPVRTLGIGTFGRDELQTYWIETFADEGDNGVVIARLIPEPSAVILVWIMLCLFSATKFARLH